MSYINKMSMSEKFIERDTVVETKAGKKSLVREVTIKYNPGTKKGKAIGQILDGLRRML